MQSFAKLFLGLFSGGLVVAGVATLVYLGDVWVARGYEQDAGIGFVTPGESMLFWVALGCLALPLSLLIALVVRAFARARAESSHV